MFKTIWDEIGGYDMARQSLRRVIWLSQADDAHTSEDKKQSACHLNNYSSINTQPFQNLSSIRIKFINDLDNFIFYMLTLALFKNEKKK